MIITEISAINSTLNILEFIHNSRLKEYTQAIQNFRLRKSTYVEDKSRENIKKLTGYKTILYSIEIAY